VRNRSALGATLLAVVGAATVGCAGAYRLDEAPLTLRRAPRAVLRLRWERPMARREFLDYKPQEWASAAVDPTSGILYAGSSAGRFLALRVDDGREVWAVQTEAAISSQPLLLPRLHTVYFGADDGHLYAVDTRNGHVKWRYATEGTINRAPVFADGVLLFTSSEGRIYAIDARTGGWRWQYDRESPEGFTIQGYAGVAVRGGTAYTGFADGHLVAMKVHSGDVIWTRALSGKSQFNDVDATPVLAGDLLLATNYSGGLYGISPENGSIRWQFPIEGASTPSVRGNSIFIAAPKAGLIALDLSGHQRWRQAVARGVPARPLVVGPYVFLTGSESGLVAASARDGELLQTFDPGHGISAPAQAAGGTLTVITDEGHLYAFQIAPGQAVPSS